MQTNEHRLPNTRTSLPYNHCRFPLTKMALQYIAGTSRVLLDVIHLSGSWLWQRALLSGMDPSTMNQELNSSIWTMAMSGMGYRMPIVLSLRTHDDRRTTLVLSTATLWTRSLTGIVICFRFQSPINLCFREAPLNPSDLFKQVKRDKS